MSKNLFWYFTIFRGRVSRQKFLFSSRILPDLYEKSFNIAICFKSTGSYKILRSNLQIHWFYLLIRYIMYMLGTWAQWNDPFTLNVIVEYRIIKAESCAINIDITAELLQPQSAAITVQAGPTYIETIEVKDK